MYTGKYKFAEIPVEIISIYNDVHKLCKDYKTDDEPEYTITVTPEMIDFERGDDFFSDSYLETLAVYRSFCEYAINHNVLLMHGSAVAVDGKAYVFLANSGTGKSTHTRYWCKLFEDRAVMINDDKPLLRFEDDGTITVYGSPWMGKHNVGNNVSFPLKAVAFLERGEENAVEKLTFSKAFAKLCAHTYYRNEKNFLSALFSLFDRMNDVNFYLLRCKDEINAAKTAYEGMKGSKNEA